MPLDDLAGDQRVAVEPARQRRHAHAVVDAELQRLHALPQRRGSASFPVHRIGVVGQAAHARERVIDVAAA